MEFGARYHEVAGQCAAPRTDLDNSLRPGLQYGGRNLLKNSFGGKKVLTQLARQASSVEQVVRLRDYLGPQ
jgi:hypothetical protein